MELKVSDTGLEGGKRKRQWVEWVSEWVGGVEWSLPVCLSDWLKVPHFLRQKRQKILRQKEQQKRHEQKRVEKPWFKPRLIDIFYHHLYKLSMKTKNISSLQIKLCTWFWSMWTYTSTMRPMSVSYHINFSFLHLQPYTHEQAKQQPVFLKQTAAHTDK